MTTYDYDAPIDEYGNRNLPKWGHLKQLHELLYSMERVLLYGDKADHQLQNGHTWVRFFFTLVTFFFPDLISEISHIS